MLSFCFFVSLFPFIPDLYFVGRCWVSMLRLSARQSLYLIVCPIYLRFSRLKLQQSKESFYRSPKFSVLPTSSSSRRKFLFLSPDKVRWNRLPLHWAHGKFFKIKECWSGGLFCGSYLWVGLDWVLVTLRLLWLLSKGSFFDDLVFPLSLWNRSFLDKLTGKRGWIDWYANLWVTEQETHVPFFDFTAALGVLMLSGSRSLLARIQLWEIDCLGLW